MHKYHPPRHTFSTKMSPLWQTEFAHNWSRATPRRHTKSLTKNDLCLSLTETIPKSRKWEMTNLICRPFCHANRWCYDEFDVQKRRNLLWYLLVYRRWGRRWRRERRRRFWNHWLGIGMTFCGAVLGRVLFAIASQHRKSTTSDRRKQASSTLNHTFEHVYVHKKTNERRSYDWIAVSTTLAATPRQWLDYWLRLTHTNRNIPSHTFTPPPFRKTQINGCQWYMH